MIEILHLPQPGPFPPVTEDPRRPVGITQNPQRLNLWSDTDTPPRNYQRSPWGTWTNYDESEAGGYTLPDPLKLKNGQPVKDAETWWKQRRPEILNDYLTEIYGKIPANTPKVTWEVTKTDDAAANGKAIMKTVVGHIDNSAFPSASPSINITMYTPSNAKGPVPMMVIVSGGAPAGGARRGAGTQPTAAAAPARGGFGGGANSPMAQCLAIGWGYATVNTGAIQPDNSAGLSTGIIGLTSEGQPRNPDDWGVLSAWAWGMSRAMDYFETDKSVDAKQLGIEGHSRWGKEALWAAAVDQRWAICWPSCSGEGGASLEMRAWGESLDDVAGGESYWMAGNFLKYGGNWNKLPVDAHELISLVAPRPIFVTGGTGDQWADPHGEFLACVGAAPVYRLLGAKDMGTTEMPKPDVSLISGDLAFRMHQGPHTDSLDWPTFLEFAQKHLKTQAAH
jgi:hypothetical protein